MLCSYFYNTLFLYQRKKNTFCFKVGALHHADLRIMMIFANDNPGQGHNGSTELHAGKPQSSTELHAASTGLPRPSTGFHRLPRASTASTELHERAPQSSMELHSAVKHEMSGKVAAATASHGVPRRPTASHGGFRRCQ